MVGGGVPQGACLVGEMGEWQSRFMGISYNYCCTPSAAIWVWAGGVLVSAQCVASLGLQLWTLSSHGGRFCGSKVSKTGSTDRQHSAETFTVRPAANGTANNTGQPD
jgi:hypothetical protein